ILRCALCTLFLRLDVLHRFDEEVFVVIDFVVSAFAAVLLHLVRHFTSEGLKHVKTSNGCGFLGFRCDQAVQRIGVGALHVEIALDAGYLHTVVVKHRFHACGRCWCEEVAVVASRVLFAFVGKRCSLVFHLALIEHGRKIKLFFGGFALFKSERETLFFFVLFKKLSLKSANGILNGVDLFLNNHLLLVGKDRTSVIGGGITFYRSIHWGVHWGINL